MSLTVKESLKLNNLRSLKQITGHGGLDRVIEKVGVLDHEMITGIENAFYYGDFIITTFTALRMDKKAIDQCIKNLIDCKVAALAIKPIFIKQLSMDIIEYANLHDFPIFFIEENVYYEDLIEDLIMGMKSRNRLEDMENNINALLSGNLQADYKLSLIHEIHPNSKEEVICYYLKELNFINDEALVNIVEKYRRSRHKNIDHNVLKYKDGLLFIMTGSKIIIESISIEFNYLLERLGLEEKLFNIGISSNHSKDNLSTAINESINANRVASIESIHRISYGNIGTYKLLLDMSKDQLKTYYGNILMPILEHDNERFIETLTIYINCKGDLQKTGDVLFQHKNTIRYRVQKMKNLLCIENDHEFYETVSIAIKCKKLLNI